VVAAAVPVALAALWSAGADKRQGGGGCSRRAPCEENGGMGKFFAAGAFLTVERRGAVGGGYGGGHVVEEDVGAWCGARVALPARACARGWHRIGEAGVAARWAPTQ
jgi:hypothetical protein